jgi:hypothetical protein
VTEFDSCIHLAAIGIKVSFYFINTNQNYLRQTTYSIKMTVFWDVAPCSLAEVYSLFRGVFDEIALMMEAVRTSETSANFYQTTRRNIPEDSHLHTRCRENLISQHNA